MGRLSKPAVALSALALTITGGGAYALASSAGGTITVCVGHRGGTLYKAKTCHRGDKRLSWNKQGPQGNPGRPGTPGTYPTTLPSGQTERGVFSGESDDIGNAGAHTYATISFPIALAHAPSVQVHTSGTTTAQCPGTASNPEATAGYLCVYVQVASGTVDAFDPTTAASGSSSKWGATLSVIANQEAYLYGSWAVSAP
jgi:hypothetical protein